MKIGSTVALALICLTFGSVAGRAQNQDGQQACMNDAFAVCGQFIPDRERVAGCLRSNIQRVSLSCRVALSHWRG